jgi:helicase
MCRTCLFDSERWKPLSNARAPEKPSAYQQEDAWAVVQKAADYDQSMRHITLGKPAFDETSKRKAAASTDLTLIENGVFVEAVLRLLQKSLTPEEFTAWRDCRAMSRIPSR